MNCPKCGDCSEIVIDSRETEDGVRRRRKHCFMCDYRWTTYEISADVYKELKSKKKRFEMCCEEVNNLERILKGEVK